MGIDLDLLIDAIYGAGADAQKWPAVLGLLTAYFHGACGAMHIGDVKTSFSFGACYNLDPAASAAYAEHYFSINPLNEPLTRVPAGKVVGDHELVPRSAYQHSEFYHDYSWKFRLNGSATAVLANEQGHVSCVGVVTATGTDPYSDTELQAFQRLVPHLRRAVELNRQFAAMHARCEGSERALDHFELGVVLLGDKGIMLRANAAAEAMLRSRVGLTARQGIIYAREPVSNAHLHALIEQAVRGKGERGGSLHIPRSNGGRPLFARVLPYVGETYANINNVRAILYLRDPDTEPHQGIDLVSTAYGLTPAEARVLRLMLKVSDVKKVGEELGIKTVTVRNHMARIMAKTGTAKQTELTNMVLSSALPLRD